MSDFMVASAGTMESNDCLVTVRRQKGLTIKIESVVYAQFGKQIRRVIEDTLRAKGIEDLYVLVEDKGALDYTIRARLDTAIERLGDQDA
jgi:citrate lyase subunit gamma (acyl carrier protein)